MSLRRNQRNAIDASVKSGFKSGVHFHATGTGKSWIALEVLLAFNAAHPNKHVIWVCEHKSVLAEQFARSTLKERGYARVFDLFLVMDYATKKDPGWIHNVNSARVWSKPILLVINRAYLVSSNKYKQLLSGFGLIIHDECHSVTNKTTQEFYQFMLERYPETRCIGFSATPPQLQTLQTPKPSSPTTQTTQQPKLPFDNVLSRYTISDAYQDGVVVKPVIRWVNVAEKLTQTDVIRLFRNDINALPYKKVIVWCGMIEYAKHMAELWSCAFPTSRICVDTSETDETLDEFGDYAEFAALEENGFLFCACKHREGSDIKNLDACVFLDKVQERSPKTFVQCVGRVLRLDKKGKKKYGLIIDVRAKSPIEICDRINQFINPGSSVFPWNYTFSYSRMSNKLVKFNQLELRNHATADVSQTTVATIACPAGSPGDLSSSDTVQPEITEEQLVSRFVREVPSDPAYTERLRRELDMIIGKNLAHNILLALEILDMTNNMPHVTRGSCGSSLVCYLLGISHVDPVKYDISFSRFLSQYRSNLPDIDFDFPHSLRDEVFLKLQLKWPGKIARISNHIHFHKKSAIRQALRDNGVSGFVGKYEINEKLRKLDSDTRKQVLEDADKLEDTFRGYSLHCGGVVFFAEGIPDELKMPGSNGIIGQVTLNKEDVARDKNFKIDILSSRALSQLYMANMFRPIDFYANHDDALTSQLISRGDNIGITLAESPLMRKAMLKLRPTCLDDVAACMAIIRPTAKEARDSIIPVSLEKHIIYDDDAIRFIQEALGCEEDLADMYRRAFSKGDTKTINELKKTLPKEKHPVLKKLNCLRKYGFCKAHAYSYAQLVWQLAYCKAHRPMQFWKAALKNCNSFYRRWVHLYEASRAGVDVAAELAKEQTSIYAEARARKTFDIPVIEQLRDYGYWKFDGDSFVPGCYLDDDNGHDDTSDNGDVGDDSKQVSSTKQSRPTRPGRKVKFNGIIACSRLLDLDPGKESTVVMSLGIGKGVYLEVTVTGRIPNVAKMIGCKGRGVMFDDTTLSISSNSFKFY